MAYWPLLLVGAFGHRSRLGLIHCSAFRHSECLTRRSRSWPLGRLKFVELRYFGGLSEEETAEVLKISTRTVRRDWDLAKSWLTRELSR
jgi:hypothetical protein